MHGIRLTVVSLTLLFTSCAVQCYVLPQGLCRPQKVNILPIPYEKYLNISCWDIIYVTKSEIFRDLDHAFLRFTPNGDGSFTMDSTRVLKDSISITQTSLNFYENNRIINKYVDYESGKVYLFEDYPLAVTSNYAALFIRCSYEGGVAEDTRYIAIPSTNTLTQQDVDELLEVDKKYGLLGRLVRLPHNLTNEECL